MMQTHFSATRVVSGLQAHTTLAHEAKSLGMRRILVLIDPFIATTTQGQSLIAQLNDTEFFVSVSTAVEPDPSEPTIVELARQAQHDGIDGIIAVGGGSAIDSAKSIGLLVKKNTLALADFYFGGAQTPDAMLPLIAIPTTAGTGSEVTFVAIVTDPATQRKLLIRHPALAPNMAIVDATMSASMPATLTMATGMDALSHALEALTSTMSSPISDALALRAIPDIITHLPHALKDGSNLMVRQRLADAATMAGYAFLSGRVHLGHAVGHALGGAFHLPHGPACMVLMPGIMQLVTPHRPQALQHIADCFAVSIADVPTALATLMADCGMPRLHTLVGSHTSDVEHIIDIIQGESRLIGLSPITPSRDDWRTMIAAGW